MDNGLRPVRYDTALALEQLANADAKLGALIARVGPFALRVKSTHSPFEALLESILYQQLHANAAKAIPVSYTHLVRLVCHVRFASSLVKRLRVG